MKNRIDQYLHLKSDTWGYYCPKTANGFVQLLHTWFRDEIWPWTFVHLENKSWIFSVLYKKKPSKIDIQDTQIFIYTCLFPSCNTFPKMKQIVIMLHEPQSG